MKVLKYIEYILLALSLILFAVFMINQPKTTDSGIMDISLYWVYILLFAAVILILFFILKNSFSTKKGIITLIVLVVGIAVIIGVAYLLAPGTPIDTKVQTTESSLKITDTALYITYFAFAISIIAVIWASVRNAIRNR